MKQSDFFYLGKIVKTHGLHGQLNGKIESDDPLFYQSIQHVFLEIKKQYLPYQIEFVNIDERGFFTLKITDIISIEQARAFVNKKMFLPLHMLPKLSGNSFYFHEVIGFQVYDSNFGYCGLIEGVIDANIQPLLQIAYLGKEILIPIHNDIITKVDRKQNILHVTCPDGLIDLYIG
jgi:16S rRNA processing protein RimM